MDGILQLISPNKSANRCVSKNTNIENTHCEDYNSNVKHAYNQNYL